MSASQEQAVQLILSLSENDLLFFLGILRRLAPSAGKEEQDTEERLAAVERLVSLGREIREGLPEDWDPEKELTEALDEKYGID